MKQDDRLVKKKKKRSLHFADFVAHLAAAGFVTSATLTSVLIKPRETRRTTGAQ